MVTSPSVALVFILVTFNSKTPFTVFPAKEYDFDTVLLGAIFSKVPVITISLLLALIS